MERHGRPRLDGRPPDVRARHVEGDPPGDPGGVRRDRRFAARPRGRRRRPHRQHRHQARRADAADGRGSGRAPDLLRRARARDGSGAGRHGDARRDPPRRWHVLRVLRLHAPADPAGRAVAGEGGLRLLPRLGRRRRGRADPPTRRTDRHDQGDPRSAGDPPGRRQRDRRGVEGHRRARRPDGAGPQPSGHQGGHRRLGRRARRRRSSTNPIGAPAIVLLATGSEVVAVRRRRGADSPATTSRPAS